MELEAKEKALEALRVVAEGGFKGVEKILAIQGEVVKATGDITNVLSTGYDLDKAVGRINAKRLINLLVNELELVEVRDDIYEDESITYTFKLECAFRMLAVELMLVWEDIRAYETSKHNQ